jgi:hypothetical protein
MLSACCSGKVLELSNTSGKNPAEDHQVKYLDVKNPSVGRAIEPADHAESAKLVQVEIVEVENPKKLAATFRVEYQPRSGEKIFLGAFSLYPSDMPGKFIVATHGKVKSEGSIVVSLITPKFYKEGDVLKIGVGKIEFLAEKRS